MGKKRLALRILLWLAKHIFVQVRNLNETRDRFRENDESGPRSATEIGIKGTF